MSLETAIAALTEATSELLDAVNVSKTTLDAEVAAANTASEIAVNSAAQIQYITAIYLGAR